MPEIANGIPKENPRQNLEKNWQAKILLNWADELHACTKRERSQA